MSELHDLRESKVWQKAHQTGIKKGRVEGREEGKTIAQWEFVRKCLSNGMSAKAVAELLEIPVHTVRRLAKAKNKPS